jgi:transposase
MTTRLKSTNPRCARNLAPFTQSSTSTMPQLSLSRSQYSSQIQALDRTQPGLSMKKGRCGTMTHDYKRNGTTTLFAALNMLDGTVIGECMPRQHREFLRFLKTIDERTQPNLDLHLIVDNYATHKTPAVKRWLERHSRFHLHFTPTSGSWLNMVERFFAEITRKRIRRGVFKSVDELEQAIMDYLDKHNDQPSPTAGPRLPSKSSLKSPVRNKRLNHNTSGTPAALTSLSLQAVVPDVSWSRIPRTARACRGSTCPPPRHGNGCFEGTVHIRSIDHSGRASRRAILT